MTRGEEGGEKQGSEGKRSSRNTYKRPMVKDNGGAGLKVGGGVGRSGEMICKPPKWGQMQLNNDKKKMGEKRHFCACSHTTIATAIAYALHVGHYSSQKGAVHILVHMNDILVKGTAQ